MMEPQPEFVDLMSASFEDFVRFLFDRDVGPEPHPPKEWNPWHWHVRTSFDPEAICDYYIKLFLNPGFLLARYNKNQLEEGFWAIQGGNLDCSAHEIVFDAAVPMSKRTECIRSISHLFKHLFVAEPLDTSVHMWWDSFCYDWHCGNLKRERGGEDEELQDVFFETLSRVLAIESEICQGAALHGLGHLHHPSTSDLIDEFLREHPRLTPEWVMYARAAARFEVM